MVAITYGLARSAIGAVKDSTKRQGFFARLLNAMMEARLKQAQREIAMHSHLANGWDRAAFDVTNKDLPFGGR